MFGQIQKGFAALALICWLAPCSPGGAQAIGTKTAKDTAVPSEASVAATEQKVVDMVTEAVIYGLPLVMMDLTRRRMTNVARPNAMAAPVNQFAHAPIFPPATFKNVVRANVDTLYSSAFLDLSSEPLVLSVPESGGRYYLLPMLDAWTNVFASPGSRTTGTRAGNFVITGPDWSGKLPGGMEQIKSPTNMVWILGRTQTNGPADYSAVHAIQAGYTLTPLSKFGRPYSAPEGAVDAQADMKTPPVEQLRRMSGADFLAELAKQLTANPPPTADAPMLEKLSRIGIVPGQPFDPAKLGPEAGKSLDGAVGRTLAYLQGQAKHMGTSVNGWHIPKSNIGAFGTDYESRAYIALIALAANLPADALYPTTFVDGDGKPLNGNNRYVLHFGPGQMPPVNAFWSVTMYDPQSFFVENAIHRYAISSWMPLQQNSDGSTDIYIQHDSPGPGKEANWLPAPDGGFNLTMRMYWPRQQSPSILDGSWSPPAVTKTP
ncbi:MULTISPECIES: DUF1254 domain-containing protein [unclassified Bradyrhizobium]|uniref:DUF1254 domain-containing protein n=1 Tax=unclassified Bradyrhizobium TaxID=2631580 RepID=UPI00247B1CA1|nr:MULTISPECIES: DUF1254 domain-containing protein [unclassified Bradyrhizobium]WGR73840.1 DUF1254 domain-containing protein [Bradyrhizobium sp. ISRA426]WGR78677.1 DUF1254 domain-containing protein [Bradyrhizobium sp. ISRA430]WGR89079.1 DUF1254 domain-containing protein [Bradyrhizobium sp. ISRA432]